MRKPVAVVTGFLGSGKTTLLNAFLQRGDLSGTMIIVNEFGEIGLDHDLMVGAEDGVVLLPNGCLCCAVRSDLINTLRNLIMGPAMRRIDRVLIETTGVADPGGIVQALVTDPFTASRFRLTSVVATYDLVNGRRTLEHHAEARLQLAEADVIVVTKSDLTAGEDVEMLLRAYNPGAAVRFGADDVSMTDIFANDGGMAPTSPPSSHGFRCSDVETAEAHAVSEYRSTSIIRDEPFSQQALAMLMQALRDNLGPDLLRVKGLLAVKEDPEHPAVLQGAQTLVHDLEWLDAWPSDDRRSRLVLITTARGAEIIEDVVEMVERIADRTAGLAART